MTAFYVALWAMLVYTLAGALAGRRFGHLPLPEGRMVAIVPVFNEDPATLRDCIASLLLQTRPPDTIYVVDDGSDPPAEPYQHERVVWIRQDNTGKRRAQVRALERERYGHSSFILTVDSDSIAYPDACENALRAFSDPRVQGVTGMPMLLNRTTNALTRLCDLEFVSACKIGRTSKSVIGAVCPASGAFAMFRSRVVYQNLLDYASSGNIGDDRRLAVYSLMTGHMVAINSACVEVLMPTTIRKSYWQRMRWFKAYWRFLPWEIAVLPMRALVFRSWGLVFGLCSPIVLIWLLIVVPLTTHHTEWHGAVLWIGIAYAETFTYVTGRPHVPLRQRLATWGILTPFLMIWQVVIIRPALLHALATCRSERWHTRGEVVVAGRRWRLRLFSALWASSALVTLVAGALTHWR